MIAVGLSRKTPLFFALLITLCFSFSSNSVGAKTLGEKVCQVDISTSVAVTQEEPAKVGRIEVDENCNVTIHEPKSVSVDEAKAKAKPKRRPQLNLSNKASLLWHERTALYSLAGAGTLVSPDVCHTWYAQEDAIDIDLSSVSHHTYWSFNGAKVALIGIWSEAYWDGGTGWSKTRGPAQWVVDGNGGMSDKTHAEASFVWVGGKWAHTLRVANTVNASGGCVGNFGVVGQLPASTHLDWDIWTTDTP